MAERYADRRTGFSDARERSLAGWAGWCSDEEQIWSGAGAGPYVAELTARISAMPREFLDADVDLSALAGDVLAADCPALPGHLDAALGAVREHGGPGAATGAAVGLWLYASEDLLGPLSPPLARSWATRVLVALALRQAAVVAAYHWLVQAERREETARAVLLFSGQLPGGEPLTAARSRWLALDSVRRDEALRDMMADYQHRQRVLRRLQEQRAREAAARYTNE